MSSGIAARAQMYVLQIENGGKPSLLGVFEFKSRQPLPCYHARGSVEFLDLLVRIPVEGQFRPTHEKAPAWLGRQQGGGRQLFALADRHGLGAHDGQDVIVPTLIVRHTSGWFGGATCSSN
jgi:hypothetical protein